jgi:hypothetical protein
MVGRRGAALFVVLLTLGVIDCGGIDSEGKNGAGGGTDSGGTNQGGAGGNISIASYCERPTTVTAESASQYLGCVRVVTAALCSGASSLPSRSDPEVARRALVVQSRAFASGASVTPNGVVQCADAEAVASCADVRDNALLDACVPSPGTVVLGASCAVDEQCASLFCKRESTARCGVCAALDVPCQGPDQCPERLTCDANSGSCVQLPLVGQACVGNRCGAASFCQDGVCKGYPFVGEPCTEARGCGSGATCIGNVCVDDAGSSPPGVLVDGANCNQMPGSYDVRVPLCLSGSRCVEDSSLPPYTGTATGAAFSLPAKACELPDGARCAGL